MIDTDSWTEGLTVKQQLLIYEYFYSGGTFTNDVWKNAGYTSASTPRNWLKTTQARTALRRFSELQMDMKKDFVRAKSAAILAVIAFTSPSDIINSKGGLLPEYQENLKKLGELAYCIESIKTKINKMGFKEIEIKFADRFKALEMLSELFDFKNESLQDEQDGKKPVHMMSDKEIEDELKKFLRKKEFRKLIESRIKKK